MSEWKVATRLAVLAIVLSVLLATIGGLGLWGMQRGADGMESMYEGHMQPALVMGDIGNRLMSTRLALAISVHTTEPATLKLNLDSVAANIAEVEKSWKGYLEHLGNPEEKRLAKAFDDAKNHFIDDGLDSTLQVLRTGDLEEARRRLIKSSGPMFLSVKLANEALQKYHIEEVRRTFAEAQSRNADLRAAFIAAISAGVCFAVVFGGWVARSVSRQLGAEPAEAAGLARRVAGGDLSVPIALRAGDETSVMAQLSGMQDSLANVVKSVRQGAELVASASEQIALGNLDLSQRTEEQASAIEQTSASMKLLGDAIRQNSDNAEHASQLASAAASIATTGGAVVGNVVATMAGINESSQRIASIVGLIDDLAFQTNLLALNAAVEAARAGEMGRGFAVVAGEVRNLAHRSGRAAKEVKDLISDSVQHVYQGVGLVKDAGATMDEIVGAIQRLSDLVSDISAASAEQSAGVSRISVAVSQMDDVTQQNAALVEQSAAAAEHLKIQAQELVQTVAVFKLAPSETLVES